MNINEVFGGSFLKAEDLKGIQVRVTISKVEVKEFDDGNKIILHFQGKDKALVCNKTNASIVAENVGDPDTDSWIGSTHILTTKKVEFQGKLVNAIRFVLSEAAPVKPTAPAKPANRATQVAEPSDQDGFGVEPSEEEPSL